MASSCVRLSSRISRHRWAWRKWSIRFGQSPPPSIQATESEQNEQRQANIQEVRTRARDGSLGRNEFKTHIKKKKSFAWLHLPLAPVLGVKMAHWPVQLKRQASGSVRDPILRNKKIRQSDRERHPLPLSGLHMHLHRSTHSYTTCI